MRHEVICAICGASAIITKNKVANIGVEIHDLTKSCAVMRGEFDRNLLDNTPFCSYLDAAIKKSLV